MKNEIPKSLLFLFLLLPLLTSCNDNEKILEKYNEIKSQVESNNYKGLVSNFDEKSKKYIQLMTDTSQLSYENMKEKSKKFKLQNFSVNYLFEFSQFNDHSGDQYDALFLYYKLIGIPLFDIVSEVVVLEDEIKTGKSNYVTIARKVNETTFVSKKVIFNKEGDEYKLDFLNLCERHEKDLSFALKKYKKKYLMKIPDQIASNPAIDSTMRSDFLYTFMHYSHKDDFNPKSYIYEVRASQKKRIK